jgi:hypothetical protein
MNNNQFIQKQNKIQSPPIIPINKMNNIFNNNNINSFQSNNQLNKRILKFNNLLNPNLNSLNINNITGNENTEYNNLIKETNLSSNF